MAQLVPAVSADLDVSEPLLFATFSGGFLAAGLAAPKLGRWMDLNSAPKVMVFGSGLATAICFGLAFTSGIWSLGTPDQRA